MSLLGSSESVGVRTVFTPPTRKDGKNGQSSAHTSFSLSRDSSMKVVMAPQQTRPWVSPKPKSQLELPSLNSALCRQKNHIQYRTHYLSSVPVSKAEIVEVCGRQVKTGRDREQMLKRIEELGFMANPYRPNYPGG